jgi:hypothetical protein
MFAGWGWGTYIFFAVFLAGGIAWVWFCLPETKGVSLEDMDKIFGSHTGAEDAVLLAQARADVGLVDEDSEHAVFDKASEKGEKSAVERV